MVYFTSNAFQGFGNDPLSFYAIYEAVFLEILEHPTTVFEDEDFEAVSFGDSNSDYETEVAPFYQFWFCYTTTYAFGFVDKWDTRDAPDRRVRRLMEKDNKKIRDSNRREHTQTVRQLAKFVNKRDPRVQAWKTERARAKAEAEKAHNERQAAQRKKMLAKVFDSVDNEQEQAAMAQELDALDSSSDEEEAKVQAGTYCMACNKRFKSAKQWENHQRSKKHLSNVASLRAELEDDDIDFVSPGDTATDLDVDGIPLNELDLDVENEGIPLEDLDAGIELVDLEDESAADGKSTKAKGKAAHDSAGSATSSDTGDDSDGASLHDLGRFVYAAFGPKYSSLCTHIFCFISAMSVPSAFFLTNIGTSRAISLHWWVSHCFATNGPKSTS